MIGHFGYFYGYCDEKAICNIIVGFDGFGVRNIKRTAN
jgi:hypothetical protein